LLNLHAPSGCHRRIANQGKPSAAIGALITTAAIVSIQQAKRTGLGQSSRPREACQKPFRVGINAECCRLEFVALSAHFMRPCAYRDFSRRKAGQGMANLREASGVYLRRVPVDESSPTCHIETFNV
jgi:hypothetical protein